MKKLELNVDNLFLLREADEMKGKSLKDWTLNNEDILIDFDNKIIYTGIIKFKEDFVNLIDWKNQDLLSEGVTPKEINLRLQASNDNEETVLNGLFKNYPEEKRSGLALELLLKIRDRTYKEKSDYLDKKVDLLLGKSKQLKAPKDPLVINTIPEEKSNKLENPYPRIFKDYNAFLIFEKLMSEFGNTKDNLANYSFVYHRMLKDNLIYDDLQKLQFTYFLLNFDIKIDRIKRFEDIGKKQLRESIYSKAK